MPIFYGGDSITPIIHLPPNVGSRSITANGTYYASDSSLDGYSSVTVNVANKFSAMVDGTITTVTADDLAGIISIRAQAFSNCTNLTSVTIPDSVTSIGAYAFRGSGLTNITIGNSVTSIGGWAFENCTNLTNVVIIPDSVTSIGAYAFQWCTRVTSYIVEAVTPPTLSIGAFNYISSNCKIYVPAQSVNAYKSASNWSDYYSHIEAIPS